MNMIWESTCPNKPQKFQLGRSLIDVKQICVHKYTKWYCSNSLYELISQAPLLQLVLIEYHRIPIMLSHPYICHHMSSLHLSELLCRGDDNKLYPNIHFIRSIFGLAYIWWIILDILYQLLCSCLFHLTRNFYVWMPKKFWRWLISKEICSAEISDW